MKKALLLYFMSLGTALAQKSSKYSLLEGKDRDLVYAQITEDQGFCTYEAFENPEKIDSVWTSFYQKELLKFNPSDSCIFR
jgi:hypothetical protein